MCMLIMIVGDRVSAVTSASGDSEEGQGVEPDFMIVEDSSDSEEEEESVEVRVYIHIYTALCFDNRTSKTH